MSDLSPVWDIITTHEHPPAKMLELLSEIAGFDAINWREQGGGRSVLHMAIEAGRLDLMTSLLKRGCDVDATASLGQTPLYSACESGRLDMVKVLVGYDANINKTKVKINHEVFDGTRWDTIHIQRVTALSCAVLCDHMKIVNYLLAHGARVDMRALGVAISKALHAVKVGKGNMNPGAIFQMHVII
jgi:ankyrin repeat protein